jgi:molybdate transport system regulatory protein
MKPLLSANLLDEKMRFRVQIKHAVAIGPGKADVLQGIAETGSLAEAGRRLGMSYQRVWSLVDAMNRDFVAPLVLKQRGGAAGGGARLTATGEQVLASYRAIERDAQRAIARRLPALVALIRPEAQPASSRAATPGGTRGVGAPVAARGRPKRNG